MIMKKVTLLLAMGLLFPLCLLSQNSNDTISYSKGFGGYKFEQNGKILKVRDMVSIMENNEEASKLMAKAKTNYNTAMVCSYAGGFLVGWSLGTAIGGEANWTPAAVGAGFILLAIPLGRGFNKNAIAAVKIYNSEQREQSDNTPVSLKFGLTPSGVGLSLKL